jgi:hypothetical protein
VLADLALGGLDPPPVGTPRQLAAVRHAISVWEVNTVVVATDPALSTRQLGRDPIYAAAFMTAALGRAPTLEAGAWVWNNVQVGSTGPLELKAGTLATCTAAVEGKPGVFKPTMQLPDCVAGGVLGTR